MLFIQTLRAPSNLKNVLFQKSFIHLCANRQLHFTKRRSKAVLFPKKKSNLILTIPHLKTSCYPKKVVTRIHVTPQYCSYGN
jgi:hypothetical protein